MTASTDSPAMRPSSVGPEAGTAPARHRSLPSRRRGLFWAGVLVALVAVVGGTLITVTAWTSESAPETTAVAYFQALGRGDAPAALGLGDVPPGVHTYLTREVLQAGLKIARISDVRVLSVTRTGRTARVTLQYQLNYSTGSPATVTDAVTTVRHGRGWRLTRTAVPVRLDAQAAGARMNIAGAPVPTASVLFFPGALPVGLDTPNLEVNQLVVHLNGAVPNIVAPKVSSTGQEVIGSAVGAAVRSCLTGNAAGPCPVPTDPRVVPGSVRGAVTGDLADQLSISIQPDANGLLAVTGVVDVKGTYKRLDFNNQPVTKTGPVELMINARCYASNPGKLVWESTS